MIQEILVSAYHQLKMSTAVEKCQQNNQTSKENPNRKTEKLFKNKQAKKPTVMAKIADFSKLA